jgi:hypothetical protein
METKQERFGKSPSERHWNIYKVVVPRTRIDAGTDRHTRTIAAARLRLRNEVAAPILDITAMA